MIIVFLLVLLDVCHLLIFFKDLYFCFVDFILNLINFCFYLYYFLPSDFFLFLFTLLLYMKWVSYWQNKVGHVFKSSLINCVLLGVLIFKFYLYLNLSCFSCHINLLTMLLIYNTINITGGCFCQWKIFIKRLMFLRWNWHLRFCHFIFCFLFIHSVFVCFLWHYKKSFSLKLSISNLCLCFKLLTYCPQ